MEHYLYEVRYSFQYNLLYADVLLQMDILGVLRSTSYSTPRTSRKTQTTTTTVGLSLIAGMYCMYSSTLLCMCITTTGSSVARCRTVIVSSPWSHGQKQHASNCTPAYRAFSHRSSVNGSLMAASCAMSWSTLQMEVTESGDEERKASGLQKAPGNIDKMKPYIYDCVESRFEHGLTSHLAVQHNNNKGQVRYRH